MTSRTLATAQAYLAAHVKAIEEGLDRPRAGASSPPSLFVTISREAGAGAEPVALALARILSDRRVGTSKTAWAVFDKEILQRVIEDEHFPESLAKDLERPGAGGVGDILSDLVGLWPSAYTLLSKTSQMMLDLAQLGNAIVIGRAGSVVLRSREGGLHIRLVASFWRRLRYLRERDDLPPEKAEKALDKIDEGRRKYVKRYFDKDLEDPLLYDLVLNTDHLGYEGAAEVIAAALQAKTALEATRAKRLS